MKYNVLFWSSMGSRLSIYGLVVRLDSDSTASILTKKPRDTKAIPVAGSSPNGIYCRGAQSVPLDDESLPALLRLSSSRSRRLWQPRMR